MSRSPSPPVAPRRAAARSRSGRSRTCRRRGSRRPLGAEHMTYGTESAAGDASPRGRVAGGSDVARVFRESSGRAVATLVRVFGDIDLAEDAVQEAFAVAAQRWRSDGLPPNPGGWIVTTARNKALDRLRRESTRPGRESASVALVGEPEPEPEAGPVE